MSEHNSLQQITRDDPNYAVFFDDASIPQSNPNYALYYGDAPIPKRHYRIYNDGGHYIARPIEKKGYKKFKNATKPRLDIDAYFDTLFVKALQTGIRRKDPAFTQYIKERIVKLYPNIKDLDAYVEQRSLRAQSNLYKRIKRFRRKANLNPWNYFVTFTYNDILHTEDTFKEKLRKTLSNLHTRRGWRYMGVFERAPETGRLHFHGIFYIPAGEMIGKLVEKTDYDKRKGKQQTTIQSTYFNMYFGRNDFKELSEMGMSRAIEYTLKYIGKTNERIVYSRNIPTEIVKELEGDSLAVAMRGYITRYVLYDDVVDWQEDIHKLTYKQITMTEYLSNPLS